MINSNDKYVNSMSSKQRNIFQQRPGWNIPIVFELYSF